MNVDKHNHMKEKGMLVILISLITLFIYLLNNDEYIDDFYKKIKDNRVEAALSQNEEIKQPDYNNFEFINKEQFFKYQTGMVGEWILYYDTFKESNEISENFKSIMYVTIDSVEFLEDYNINNDYSYIKIHIILKNSCVESGLFKIKPMCQIMLEDATYDEINTDKFKLIDMKFDTDIEGYTLPEIDNSSNNLNSDMGYVKTDDWKSFAFRVYIESNSEISYTCVFRTPKEYADDENLVIGNDDSHASRRWDGEKEVTYDNGGYRIYINRQ